MRLLQFQREWPHHDLLPRASHQPGTGSSPSPLPSCPRSRCFQVWVGPLGMALLPPMGFLLHPLTQGPPATCELWSRTAGLQPEAAKVRWLLLVLEQGCPERVKRRAPPSLYISLLLGDLPGSLCWLCPNQTKRAGAFQRAASQKVGCCRAGLCWDPGWPQPPEDAAAAASWCRRLGGSWQSSLVPVCGCSACSLLCVKLFGVLGARRGRMERNFSQWQFDGGASGRDGWPEASDSELLQGPRPSRAQRGVGLGGVGHCCPARRPGMRSEQGCRGLVPY